MTHRTLLLIAFLTAFLTAQPALKRFPHTIEHSVRVLNPSGMFEETPLTFLSDSGSMLVPEDPRSDNGRRIRLPIVRFHAIDTAAHPPVFWLSGGPGQSNMHTLRFDTFIDSSDHIMVGYRGVDGT